MKFKFQGLRNPALVALSLVESWGWDINTESFAEAAKFCGERPEGEPGFVVQSSDDLTKLLELGEFTITIKEGVAYAIPNKPSKGEQK